MTPKKRYRQKGGKKERVYHHKTTNVTSHAANWSTRSIDM